MELFRGELLLDGDVCCAWIRVGSGRMENQMVIEDIYFTALISIIHVN